jgi:hypothetical protein
VKLSAAGIFATAATVLVAAAIVTGIAITGSPQKARVRGLDQQRV